MCEKYPWVGWDAELYYFLVLSIEMSCKLKSFYNNVGKYMWIGRVKNI